MTTNDLIIVRFNVYVFPQSDDIRLIDTKVMLERGIDARRIGTLWTIGAEEASRGGYGRDARYRPIAATFCMYNRYVDGLGTTQPKDEVMYRERGKRVARDGYVSASKDYLPAVAAR